MCDTAYRTAVRALEERGMFSVKNSNLHTKMCLNLLGNPEKSFRAVHVAGTNGKGSVCAFLASALEESGKKTGLFTSPHLVRINERIVTDGSPVSDGDFAHIYEKVANALSCLPERGEALPSYFEFLFLMACVCFAERGVDTAVIETGLGGRLDATNSLSSPDISVITRIAYDHMQYLGNTLGEIAGEKAGIIKAGVPVVCAGCSEEALAPVLKRAGEMNAPVYVLRREDCRLTGFDTGRIDFDTSFSFGGHHAFTIAANAPWQAENAALSVLALKVLKEREREFYGDISYENVSSGLLKMRWPGRMEEISPGIFIDGAHNTDGIRGFTEAVRAVLAARRETEPVLVFSAVRDKDLRGMIGLLVREVSWKRIILTEIRGGRKTEAAALRKLFGEAGRPDAYVMPALSSAIEEAERQRSGSIFICGSLYLAGEAEEILHDQL